MSSQMIKMLPKLQGHKGMIWEELYAPSSLRTLYVLFKDKISPSSIRRCLSEMRRDGYIIKTPFQEKKGTIGRGLWKRREEVEIR